MRGWTQESRASTIRESLRRMVSRRQQFLLTFMAIPLALQTRTSRQICRPTFLPSVAESSSFVSDAEEGTADPSEVTVLCALQPQIVLATSVIGKKALSPRQVESGKKQ